MSQDGRTNALYQRKNGAPVYTYGAYADRFDKAEADRRTASKGKYKWIARPVNDAEMISDYNRAVQENKLTSYSLEFRNKLRSTPEKAKSILFEARAAYDNVVADTDEDDKKQVREAADKHWNDLQKFAESLKVSTKDKLIESSSEEAFSKNVATEIKAGKDPKQAAAIAYSIQKENDSNMKDGLNVIVKLNGRTYKGAFNGISGADKRFGDVYIPELVSLHSGDRGVFNPDEGNYVSDGKFYFKMENLKKWNPFLKDYIKDSDVTDAYPPNSFIYKGLERRIVLAAHDIAKLNALIDDVNRQFDLSKEERDKLVKLAQWYISQKQQADSMKDNKIKDTKFLVHAYNDGKLLEEKLVNSRVEAEQLAKEFTKKYGKDSTSIKLVDSNITDADPVKVEKIIRKEKSALGITYYLFQTKSNSGATIYYEVTDKTYHGEPTYSGGGVISFSLKTANDSLDSHLLSDKLKAKYGEKEGTKRYLHGENDSAIKDADMFNITFERNGVYQSNLVKASSEEEAKQKFMSYAKKHNLPDAKIISVSPNKEGYKPGKPVIDGESIKDAPPVDVLGIVQSKRDNTGKTWYLLSISTKSGNKGYLVTGEYDGGFHHSGGGAVSFNLNTAKADMDAFITIANLKSKYGEAEGYKRYMAGQKDSTPVKVIAKKAMETRDGCSRHYLEVEDCEGKRFYMVTDEYDGCSRQFAGGGSVIEDKTLLNKKYQDDLASGLTSVGRSAISGAKEVKSKIEQASRDDAVDLEMYKKPLDNLMQCGQVKDGVSASKVDAMLGINDLNTTKQLLRDAGIKYSAVTSKVSQYKIVEGKCVKVEE